MLVNTTIVQIYVIIAMYIIIQRHAHYNPAYIYIYIYIYIYRPIYIGETVNNIEY